MPFEHGGESLELTFADGLTQRFESRRDAALWLENSGVQPTGAVARIAGWSSRTFAPSVYPRTAVNFAFDGSIITLATKDNPNAWQDIQVALDWVSEQRDVAAEEV